MGAWNDSRLMFKQMIRWFDNLFDEEAKKDLRQNAHTKYDSYEEAERSFQRQFKRRKTANKCRKHALGHHSDEHYEQEVI